MKIIHVISSIDPAKGGPQATCVRLASAQAALGHDVHIISYGSTEIQKRAFQTAENVPCFSQVSWHLLPNPNRVEQIMCLQGARLLCTLITGGSFVHIHGVWETILKTAAHIAGQRHVSYCLQPHGMLDVWSMAQKRLKKQLALVLGYRAMLNGAKFILALNADEARLLEPLRLKAPNLVIPNGIFLEEFSCLPSKGFFPQYMPNLHEKRIVLFLSRLHSKKGLDILAKAFARLARSHPDVDLVIAGPDGGARTDLVSLIGQLELTGRIHLAGPLYGDDKLRALVDASCFCLPSRQEGFSVAITEAMACGLPVVISDACHFPEVEAARAGFVVPLDPAKVATALANILDNPQLASIMGRNGRQLVRDNYTWPRIAELALDGYSSSDICSIKSAPNSGVLVPVADH